MSLFKKEDEVELLFGWLIQMQCWSQTLSAHNLGAHIVRMYCTKKVIIRLANWKRRLTQHYHSGAREKIGIESLASSASPSSHISIHLLTFARSYCLCTLQPAQFRVHIYGLPFNRQQQWNHIHIHTPVRRLWIVEKSLRIKSLWRSWNFSLSFN